MTLNLHTWQEADQLRKFRTIADAIVSEGVDVACFQEVGELWNGGRGDPATHAGRLIRAALPGEWHLFSDWSHIGFDRYRESVAILSRFPFGETASAWISAGTSPHDIHSRKAVRARILVPGSGALDVVSTHLSWPENGFFDQFARLSAWLDSVPPAPLGALVCGDFNLPLSGPHFPRLVRATPWEEQFLKAADPAVFRRVFREGGAPPPGDGRIDYLWLTPGSPLRADSAEILFTPSRLGPVSDHPAYAVAFALP